MKQLDTSRMPQRRTGLSPRTRAAWLLAAAVLLTVGGCRPAHYRKQADEVAAAIIAQGQLTATGRVEPVDIEPPADALRRRLLVDQDLPYSHPASLGSRNLDRPEHWPEADYPPPPAAPGKLPSGEIHLTLLDALQVAAANNREYQSRKEDIFRAALALDLERNSFRYLFFGTAETLFVRDFSTSPAVSGIESGVTGRVTRQLATGAALTGRIALDLVQLLSPTRDGSMGIVADGSIAIPLLRGSGRHIVTEPLTQAERDVLYQVWSFERFKQTLAVRVAAEYLAVLQQQDQVRNAEDNYRRLGDSFRRARRLADAGRLPEIQVDQARQDELRARDRWVVAMQSYARRQDTFKIVLGLPTDASIELDREELLSLADAARVNLERTEAVEGERADAPPPAGPLVPPSREGGGPLEMDYLDAIAIALAHRTDLHTAAGRVYDSQRRVTVAADGLRAELTLAGTARMGQGRSLGSADQPNAQLRPERGTYTAAVFLDLPIERTAERNAYRDSYIALERSVRGFQELEDQVKLEIRDALRTLISARESFRIQTQAVALAERRVQSTELFVQAGRANIRDELEAQEALVNAQNALTAALVNYRVAELELQRDMGVLDVDERGLWREYQVDAQQ